MLPVAAATTQDKIQDARNAKSQTESSLDETQSRIQALESKKGESEAYLEELNAQLTDLKTAWKNFSSSRRTSRRSWRKYRRS